MDSTETQVSAHYGAFGQRAQRSEVGRACGLCPGDGKPGLEIAAMPLAFEFGGINGRCRVHRAELLRISGTCDLAEEEALARAGSESDELEGEPLGETGSL